MAALAAPTLGAAGSERLATGDGVGFRTAAGAGAFSWPFIAVVQRWQ